MPFDAMEDLPDEALLARFADGDAAAARVLTMRLTPRLFAHAWRLLGNRAEAEDVTQGRCCACGNRRRTGARARRR